MDTCATCSHWSGEAQADLAQCRRHSPAIGPMGGLWPLTGRNDWCGDHTVLASRPRPQPFTNTSKGVE